MKTISVNSGNAVAILLGSVILRQRQAYKAKGARSKDTQPLLDELKEIYTDEREFRRIENSAALALLDKDNQQEDGLALEASILGLHYEIEDFGTQNTLKEILFGDNNTLQEAIAEGKILLKAAGSKYFFKLSDLADDLEDLDDEVETSFESPAPELDLKDDDQKTAAVNDITGGEAANSSSKESGLQETIEAATNQVDAAAPYNEFRTADVNPEIIGQQEHSTFNFQGEPTATEDEKKPEEAESVPDKPVESENTLDNDGPVAQSEEEKPSPKAKKNN